MIPQKQYCQTLTAVCSGLSIDEDQLERSTFMGMIVHRLLTQTPYGRWRSSLVDRLLVLVEGDHHV